MLLEAREIVKGYEQQIVLRGVSFGAAQGEIVCLLGPSGCGKSTLLRVIAGLEADYCGSVRFGGHAIDDVPVHERGFGLMFQEFALLPHRTVGQNIAFGLRMQRLERAVVARRVHDMLALIGLPGYEGRTIFELSGGERQRVALARSLAPRPRLLMLDEPLGALDRTLRERLTTDLRAIIKSVGLTSVYVTHDQVEAFAVADRVVLMDRGMIVQSAAPLALYQHPANVVAAKFLGLTNVLAGQRVTHPASRDGSILMDTALGRLVVGDAPTTQLAREIVLIRPEAAAPFTPESVNVVEGEVLRRMFRGSAERIVLRHRSGTTLELDVPAGSLPEGGLVRLALRPDALTLIDDEGGLT